MRFVAWIKLDPVSEMFYSTMIRNGLCRAVMCCVTMC